MKDLEIFESIRRKQKWGTMMGINKASNPILINEYDDEFQASKRG